LYNIHASVGVADVLKQRDGGKDDTPAAAPSKTTTARGGGLGGGTTYSMKPSERQIWNIYHFSYQST